MPTNVTIPFGTIVAFLLVLARVAGTFALAPLPGIKHGPEPVRAVLSLAAAVALFSKWPVIDAANLTIGKVTVWLTGEAALGLAVGVAVALITEGFLMAGQILGLQAGYAYASTIDPSTQADSGVLLVFIQLTAGLLFLALGLDREIMRILARSLEAQPPGQILLARPSGDLLVKLSSSIFTTGLRLALPLLAVLISVDISLALLGRINAQLQLLSLAFPAKMLGALALLASIAVLMPELYRSSARDMLSAVSGVMAH